jgi:hypothetical protein
LCGTYAYIVLYFLHVPNAVVLAVLAAVVDILPGIGFFLFVIPAVALSFTVSPTTATLAAVFYSAYHLLESYVIVPKVYGNQLKLSTLTVLIACMAGWLLAGQRAESQHDVEGGEKVGGSPRQREGQAAKAVSSISKINPGIFSRVRTAAFRGWLCILKNLRNTLTEARLRAVADGQEWADGIACPFSSGVCSESFPQAWAGKSRALVAACARQPLLPLSALDEYSEFPGICH